MWPVGIVLEDSAGLSFVLFRKPRQHSQPNRPCSHSDAEAPRGQRGGPTENADRLGTSVHTHSGFRRGSCPALPPSPEKPFLRGSQPLLSTRTSRPAVCPDLAHALPLVQAVGGHRARVCEGHKTHLRLLQLALGEAPQRLNAVPARTRASHETFLPKPPGGKGESERVPQSAPPSFCDCAGAGAGAGGALWAWRRLGRVVRGPVRSLCPGWLPGGCFQLPWCFVVVVLFFGF